MCEPFASNGNELFIPLTFMTRPSSAGHYQVIQSHHTHLYIHTFQAYECKSNYPFIRNTINNEIYLINRNQYNDYPFSFRIRLWNLKKKENNFIELCILNTTYMI